MTNNNHSNKVIANNAVDTILTIATLCKTTYLYR